MRTPTLQTDAPRSASRLELFFDLAFVLVIAQLAGALRGDASLHGLLKFAGLFTTIWWAWAGFTLYANRFDHDDVVYRLLKLVGMAAVIGLAASATQATGDRRTVFVACQLLLHLVLLLQYRRAGRHIESARRIAQLYMGAFGAGAVLWAASVFVSAPACFVLWGLAIAVEAGAPVVATRTTPGVPLHIEHLPERFALFVILVLGESVAGIAHGLSAATWSTAAVPVAVVAFVLVAALWWSYFDLAGARAKRLLDEIGGSSSHSHDVYVLGQLPLTLSLAVIGAAVQLAVVESEAGEVPTPTRLLLAGGVAVYLAAAAATNAGMSRRRRRRWWWPLAAAGLAALDAAVELPAVVIVGGLAALLVVVLVLGTAERATDRLEVQAL